MKTLCVLFALSLGFAYFYPARHESTPTACAALTQRIATLLPKDLPADTPQHLSDLTTAYTQARFPLLPQEAGCVVAYWGTTLKPDLARATITALAPSVTTGAGRGGVEPRK